MENMGKDRQTLNDFLEEAELQQYSELFRDVLKISKISQLKFVLSEDLDQIGLSKPEQRRYKKIFSKYFPNPYIDKLKKLLSSHKKHEPYSQGHSSIQMEMQPFNDTNIKVPKKHIISIEDITITKELGKGQFGVVQQGTWSTGNQRLPVAIKCLGQERMTSNSAEFLKEAAVMHSIENPNIVRLYGVVLHSDSLMLVTELAPLRSLLECLREVTIRSYFSVPTLCSFAEQICEGMSYLENKRLIHRDLAARNILVFTKYKVKISDFGLSRALGVGKDYYQTNYNVNLKLPVAWCAPECILYLRFTSASDVWAFGVCLWEMFTYGFQPWAGFSGHQILDNIDYPNSQRLDRPLCCPKPYYATMLECWTHLPSQRPKFKELEVKLRSIRPQMVKTRSDFQVPEGGRPSNYLHYNAGEVITVLGQEQNLWYGVTSSGTCGVFDPGDTMPYDPPDKCLTSVPSLSPNSTRHSARSIRSTLLRCDVKRHTYTSKRTLQRSMISSPQGDVKHTGHVGLDGAYFGDISFLDPAGCPPRQIVTPYKPSEDLEQVPLINPNSPSHLSSSSGTTPYPMLTSLKSEKEKMDCDDISGFPKSIQRSHPEPPTVTSRGAVQKVKYATLDRSCNDDPGEGCSAMEDVHEYHEISDEANESNSAKPVIKQEDLHTDAHKSSADFSESLIGEMESLFRNLDAPGRRDEPSTSAKNPEAPAPDIKPRDQTLPKAERKLRLSPTSTMKPMSAHEEKTLNIAVALANEITSKSMNDLGTDKNKYSPKFSFKFPHLSLQTHGHHSHEPEKEKESSVKHERRNFSEEAKSVPDIQSTLTAESKMAYTSLIEEPTPSTSLMSHFSKDSIIKPGNHSHSLQRNTQWGNNKHNFNRKPEFHKYPENPIPLPPRNTKPKLIDKPRHIRKYPLKIPGEPKPTLEPSEPPPIIYQNTTHPSKRGQKLPVPVVISADVHDGPEPSTRDTNPFSNGPRPAPNPSCVYDLAIPGTSSPNPFSYTFNDVDDTDLEMDIDIGEDSDAEIEEAGGLVKDFKDHVSVEDLLEFADLKPCGRQRGVESDEVRLMRKVFNKQVVPKECLQALELSDWNIHNAIKLVRVSVSVGTEVTLETIRLELDKAKGDITKASAVLSKQKT